MSEQEDRRGIHGFKSSEFLTAAQAREKLGDAAPADELPDGVRLYLKEKSLNVPAGAAVRCNLYRIVSDGGTKDARRWVAKLPPRVPEDDEIAVYGRGKYIWILKWNLGNGRETGIMSDPVEIDDSVDLVHERAPAPASLPVPAAPASSSTFGFEQLMALQDAAEEKTLARMERMASMFKAQAGPAEILSDAYKASTDMMQSSVRMALDMGKTISGKAKKEMERQIDDQDGGGDGEAEAAAGTQTLLSTYWPQIKPYVDKLLGGGPTGAAVKTLILGSEQWKEIFNDKEKFGVFVAAAEQEFGTDKAKRAMDILLNVRADKKGKKK